VALTLGLITGLIALVTAMAQLERGANRIYGVERDRPARQKYTRATIMSLVAGLPALFGFMLLVAGRPFGESAEKHWHWNGDLRVAWDLVRWPVSLALIVMAVGLLFKYSPRRRQPGLSWLLFGAVVSTVLWWLASLLLAGYVRFSGGFGATYGQLTAVMALLLWANLTGIAIFLGLAFAAQLEARRVGVRRPAKQDSWKPGAEEVPRPRKRRGVRAERSG
jgi:YihY family inner membrane protein